MNWRRNKRVILFSLLALAWSHQMKGGEVTVTGSHPEWSGRELTFFTISNPVVPVKEVLGKTRVDETGNFKAILPLDRPAKIILAEGIYNMYFYACPGSSCSLILPPHREKSREDWLNPYFQPAGLHLAFTGEDGAGLNERIRQFDRFYNPVYNELAVQVYGRRKVDGLERAVEMLEERFPADTGFFLSYRNHRLAALRYLSRQHEAKDPADIPVPDTLPEWNNPAFHELFTLSFSGVLKKIAVGENYEAALRSAYVNRDPERLAAIFAERLELNSVPLIEMAMVKGLYDAANSEDIPVRLAAGIIEKLASQSDYPSVSRYAAATALEMLRLQPGSVPPPILTADGDGIAETIPEGKGEYTYLAFGSMDSYAFLRELPLIREIAVSLTGTLRVVVVLAGMDVSSGEQEDPIGPGLDVRRLEFGTETLSAYRVKAFPTFFLIGPDGRFLWSPAPSPTEMFLEKFTRHLEQDQ